MYLPEILEIVLKLFTPVLIGVAFKYRAKDRAEPFIGMLTDIFWYAIVPLFVLFSLWEVKISGEASFLIVGGALFVIGFSAFLAYVYNRIFKVGFKDIVVPVSFMNSGYLGLAVSKLVLGDWYTAMMSVFNIIVAVLIFTVGLGIIGGKKVLKVFYGIPVIYALLAGVILNYYNIKIPPFFRSSVNNFNNITPYLMLGLVGMRLEIKTLERIKLASGCALLRLGGGLIAGFVYIFIVNPGPKVVKLIILASSLPSAVNSFLLTEKYGKDPALSSAIVTVSTLLYVFFFPLLYMVLVFI
ncbi:MAG: AEC family transporter [Elusimicrobiota bacterium]